MHIYLDLFQKRIFFVIELYSIKNVFTICQRSNNVYKKLYNLENKE